MNVLSSFEFLIYIHMTLKLFQLLWFFSFVPKVIQILDIFFLCIFLIVIYFDLSSTYPLLLKMSDYFFTYLCKNIFLLSFETWFLSLDTWYIKIIKHKKNYLVKNEDGKIVSIVTELKFLNNFSQWYKVRWKNIIFTYP